LGCEVMVKSLNPRKKTSSVLVQFIVCSRC
jgi:hypothetical protein